MNNIPSTSGIHQISDNELSVLSALENNESPKSTISSNDVKTEITKFSNLFSSVYRIPLLSCSRTEAEEFVYLLLMLKKNIKLSIQELNKSLDKHEYNFTCGLCRTPMKVKPGKDMWATLQEHEHFEQLVHDFVSHKDLNLPEEESCIDNIYNNTDSGIEQNENDHSPNEDESKIIQNRSSTPKEEIKEEEVNSFRFNFFVSYDEVIESKIYPPSLMSSIRKIDKMKDCSMQRAGNTRAVCLLCPCEMTRVRVTKFVLANHAMGQRHLKAASHPLCILSLEKYHELWLQQELSIQAHQVYFRPGTDPIPNLVCSLCNMFVSYTNVLAHIRADPHKRKVLDLYQKRNHSYFLLNLHVQVYGITQEQYDAKENEALEKEKENIGKKQKDHNETKSDSETSDDGNKLPAHNIIKAVENPDSTNVLDLMPHRYQVHRKFIKKDKSTNQITCEACKCSLPEDLEVIKSHIRQAGHIRLSKTDFKKFSYYCEMCNVKILDEMAWKKHFTQGSNRHGDIAPTRKEKVKEYECTVCQTVIYGDELSLSRHRSVGLRRHKKDKVVRLPEPIKKLLSSKEAIRSEGKRLTNEAEDVLKNNLTNDCCKRLEYCLQEIFEDCKVYPFGSRISGLGNKYSDLDVFVDIGDMYLGDKCQDAITQMQLVRKASKAFFKYKDEFSNVVQIPTARTPIIKICHIPTDLDCDLSFRHGLSVENTKFLRFCLDLQPITQPFALILKKWSEHNNLDQMPTYAFAIIAIFYLQKNGYLLSVKKIRELNQGKCQTINGWETITYTLSLEEMKTHVKTYPSVVEDLLKEFFNYYSKQFQYNTEVICPLLGHTILKSDFTNDPTGKDLPREMSSYVRQLNSEEAELFRATAPFCIQDPFDLSHNLTKACQQGTVEKFKTLCELTVKHLEVIK